MFNPFPFLKELFDRVKGHQRKYLIIAIITSSATVLASSSLMAFSAFIISFAALQPSVAEILVPVTAVRFFGLCRAILRYIERLVSHNAVFSYLSRLRVRLYEGVSNMNGEQLLRFNRSDALNILTADIETLQDVFLRAILPLFSSLLLYFVVLIPLFKVHLIFAIVFGLFYPLATLCMAILAKKMTLGKNKRFSKRLGCYKTQFTTFYDDLSELNWNKRSIEFETALNQSSECLESDLEQIAFGKIIATQGQQLLINMSVFVTLIIGISLVEKQMLSGIFLAVCIFVIFSLYESAPAFLTLFQKLESGEYSAQRMLELIETSSIAYDDSETKFSASSYGFIQYDHLNFKYDGSSVLLRDIDFAIGPNMKIAIVGASGSGKSTLASILCGLIAPHSGSITLQGKPIDLGYTETLMSHFSVINQEVYLFHQRLMDNLYLADSNCSLEDIECALTFAGLEEWVNSKWLHTNPWIGEDGMALSGGQRQRLGLARALLRKAPYLILDEAFAGLDIETEAEILKNLLSLKERSIIWITHRLIQMDQMDQIYVLDKGQCIALGTHAELLKTCEVYRTLNDMNSHH